MDDFVRFTAAALATWRVTHLIAREDGPWDVVARTRARVGQSFLGKLMDCFLCLSLWVAAAATMVVAPKPRDWILVWLGLSGAACLLDRLGRDPVIVEKLSEYEGVSEHELLRADTADSTASGSGTTPERYTTRASA